MGPYLKSITTLNEVGPFFNTTNQKFKDEVVHCPQGLARVAPQFSPHGAVSGVQHKNIYR